MAKLQAKRGRLVHDGQVSEAKCRAYTSILPRVVNQCNPLSFTKPNHNPRHNPGHHMLKDEESARDKPYR